MLYIHYINAEITSKNINLPMWVIDIIIQLSAIIATFSYLVPTAFCNEIGLKIYLIKLVPYIKFHLKSS